MSGLADDPAELFGAEALVDARALRRAYARLIKQHGPESDPAGFAHIHARFEAVRARQAAGEPPRDDGAANAAAGAPTPAGEAGAPDAAPGPAGRGAEAWAARTATVGADVDGLLRDLEAAGPTDLDAAILHFTVEASRRPAEALDRFYRLLALPGADSHAYGLACVALALDPTGLHHRWPEVAAAMGARASGIAADAARLDVLLLRGEVLVAWEHWRECGARFLQAVPQVARSRFSDLVRRAGWALPEERLGELTATLEDVHLPLPDEDRDTLDLVARTIGALRAAAADPEVPPALIAALRRLAGADGTVGGPGGLLVLRDLVAALPNLPEQLDTLDRAHPVLASMVDRRLAAASGRYEYALGTPRPMVERPALQTALRELEAELQARAQPVRGPGWKGSAASSARRGAAGVGTLGLVVAAGLATQAFDGFFEQLSHVVPALFMLMFFALRANGKPPTITRTPQVPAAPPAAPRPVLPIADVRFARARLLTLATQHGAWMHELCPPAAEAGLRLVLTELEVLLADRWIDLRVLGPETVRRVLAPAPGAPA